MKVDVAVQSYKKPESLLYALMSLKKYSAQHINNIFINDDSTDSLEELEKIFLNEKVTSYFAPSKIFLRKNTIRVGYWPRYVKGYWPSGITPLRMAYVIGKSYLKNRHVLLTRQDVRYQFAFDNAETKYLYVIHDDIIFHEDTLGLYLKEAEENQLDVVGDMGQCWRCCYNKVCTPEKISQGCYPSNKWPVGKYNKKQGLNHLACRINEWSALVKVETEREIVDKYRVFFGNYEDDGDIAAYWFKMIVTKGYKFKDPLPSEELRSKYYTHGWNGHSGHSVWVDQGGGKTVYNGETICNKMLENFGKKLI